MSAVLGIDAAWTAKHPSGLAVGVKAGSRWRIAAAACSYSEFTKQPAPSHDLPLAANLLDAAADAASRPISLVSIDMPLAHTSINGRREADNSVSRAYGARKAGTHSPSSSRPGAMSAGLTGELASAGFPLLTEAILPPGTIEVYPHPALIELMDAPERLKYKVTKASKYWPNLPLIERREMLLSVWRQITSRLAIEMDGVEDFLPRIEATSKLADLKAFEDMLDAMVCVWVGIQALNGNAIPFGDTTAAIWIPALRTKS